MKFRLPLFLFMLAVVVLALPLRSQATLNVPSTSYPTIQSAILAAMPGDLVKVAPGCPFGKRA